MQISVSLHYKNKFYVNIIYGIYYKIFYYILLKLIIFIKLILPVK